MLDKGVGRVVERRISLLIACCTFKKGNNMLLEKRLDYHGDDTHSLYSNFNTKPNLHLIVVSPFDIHSAI